MPTGAIDNFTFYNIVGRIDPALVNRAAQQNPPIKLMLSNLSLDYDDEVHKNLTYALPLAAGFNSLDANAIAYADVLRDYDSDSNPLP